MQTTRKIEPNIFPMLYPFYEIRTKSFIIFGSAHDLLHKIKHIAKTAQKEKEKNTVQRVAGKSARRPAHSCSAYARAACAALSLHAVTNERVPLVRPSSPLSLRDADGEVPPVSSFSVAHGGSATTPASVGEGLGPCARVH